MKISILIALLLLLFINVAELLVIAKVHEQNKLILWRMNTNENVDEKTNKR